RAFLPPAIAGALPWQPPGTHLDEKLREVHLRRTAHPIVDIDGDHAIAGEQEVLRLRVAVHEEERNRPSLERLEPVLQALERVRYQALARRERRELHAGMGESRRDAELAVLHADIRQMEPGEPGAGAREDRAARFHCAPAQRPTQW